MPFPSNVSPFFHLRSSRSRFLIVSSSWPQASARSEIARLTAPRRLMEVRAVLRSSNTVSKRAFFTGRLPRSIDLSIGGGKGGGCNHGSRSSLAGGLGGGKSPKSPKIPPGIKSRLFLFAILILRSLKIPAKKSKKYGIQDRY